MGLSWLTQLFHSLVHLMDSRPLNKPHMLVFAKDVYRGTASSVDNILKDMPSFLQDGLGREFLIVTVKESTRRGRTAYLMVDRMVDGTKKYPDGQDGLLADLAQCRDEADAEAADLSSTNESDVEPNPTIESTTTSSPSTSTNQHSSSHSQLSGAQVKHVTKRDTPYALDRLSIFADKNGIKRELGKVKFDVLMTMDLTRSKNPRPITIESFTHIFQTTSRNTPRYRYIFAQCYWCVYTIWKILEMEMHPHINLHRHHARRCVYSAYPQAVVLGGGSLVDTVKTPEMVKMQWEAERTRRDEEWAALALASRADHCRAEEACRLAEEAEEGLRQAEAQIRELQAKLEASERRAGSARAV
ncbi:hypothetical protein EDD18DRAFT_170867 [Armillaria luteobubalina]|uniref:Uncharacterized protein n=1 Tax=Armillaria luteobubalina TaxID=153913 RepID=A0AA39UP99_9AGAR|nr:hypothetical protein EDD18DRAFT_170867 [Armillaria luteobubalina]